MVLFSKPFSIFHKSISKDCEIFEYEELELREFECECECEWVLECEGVRLPVFIDPIELIEAIEQ